MGNILYFHKRRIFIAIGFCTGYGLLCWDSTKYESETFRLGVAGSLAMLICECAFHLVDTVNIKMKTAEGKSAQKTTWQAMRSIYAKEGAYGFARGFSACFYGSIFCGFTYFFMYKTIKQSLYEMFPGINSTKVFFLASLLAECITIIVHFPYDLIKCRI